jgi:hypothetical protein
MEDRALAAVNRNPMFFHGRFEVRIWSISNLKYESTTRKIRATTNYNYKQSLPSQGAVHWPCHCPGLRAGLDLGDGKFYFGPWAVLGG